MLIRREKQGATVRFDLELLFASDTIQYHIHFKTNSGPNKWANIVFALNLFKGSLSKFKPTSCSYEHRLWEVTLTKLNGQALTWPCKFVSKFTPKTSLFKIKWKNNLFKNLTLLLYNNAHITALLNTSVWLDKGVYFIFYFYDSQSDSSEAVLANARIVIHAPQIKKKVWKNCLALPVCYYYYFKISQKAHNNITTLLNLVPYYAEGVSYLNSDN